MLLLSRRRALCNRTLPGARRTPRGKNRDFGLVATTSSDVRPARPTRRTNVITYYVCVSRRRPHLVDAITHVQSVESRAAGGGGRSARGPRPSARKFSPCRPATYLRARAFDSLFSVFSYGVRTQCRRRDDTTVRARTTFARYGHGPGAAMEGVRWFTAYTCYIPSDRPELISFIIPFGFRTSSICYSEITM